MTYPASCAGKSSLLYVTNLLEQDIDHIYNHIHFSDRAASKKLIKLPGNPFFHGGETALHQVINGNVESIADIDEGMEGRRRGTIFDAAYMRDGDVNLLGQNILCHPVVKPVFSDLLSNRHIINHKFYFGFIVNKIAPCYNNNIGKNILSILQRGVIL